MSNGATDDPEQSDQDRPSGREIAQFLGEAKSFATREFVVTQTQTITSTVATLDKRVHRLEVIGELIGRVLWAFAVALMGGGAFALFRWLGPELVRLFTST